MSEEKDHDRILASIFERLQSPLELTNLSIKINGVYSLPELLKSKIGDPGEAGFNYEISICDCKFSGGNLLARELTEEEKKEAEESGKGKKAPPPAKGKGKAEDALSPEEEEKLELERVEKEAILEKERAEWDALDEDTKFYRTNEDIYKQPFLTFDKPAPAEGEEPEKAILNIDKTEESLCIMEEYINAEKGVWLQFTKLPLVEDEDPKKKGKAAAGGKKGAGEAIKPLYGRAWIDFADFRQPGGVTVIQRAFLKTLPPPIPEGDAGVDSRPESPEHYFEESKSYIHIELTLSNPINPPVPANPVPSLKELISRKPPLPKFPTTKDATEDYRLQLRLAVEAISKEYQRYVEREEKGEKSKKEQNLTERMSEKRREDRKDKFLYEFNTSGRYHMLKEKLKKTVIRIVREKHSKSGTVHGVTKDERDHIYSQLYTYLVEQMHLTIDTMVKEKRDQLHEDVVASKELAQREIDVLMNKTNKETLSERYLRLFKEYDRAEEYDKAEKYILDLLKLEERNIDIWNQYARFSLKIGDLSKADMCMKECISISGPSSSSTPLELAYGGLLTQRKRYKEASIILQSIIDREFTDINTNLLLGVMYEMDDHIGLTRKHIAIAKRQRQRELGLLKPKGRLVDMASGGGAERALTDNETDHLFHALVNFLLLNWLTEVAGKALQYIVDKETPLYFMQRGKELAQRREYQESVDVFLRVLQIEPKNQEAWILKGHSLFYMGNLFDSEECYINAIRLKPEAKSISVHERLGEVYMRRQAYKDAKVVFYKTASEFNTAASWRNLGISLLREEEMEAAEDALTQSNVLDNLNPDTWGYLTMLCLLNGQRQLQAMQSLREAFKLRLANSQLLEEIGQLYFKLQIYNVAQECYEIAVQQSPQNGLLWAKLGDTCLNIEGKKEDGIDCFKNAFEYTDGENNKEKIAQTLYDLLSEEGREKEVNDLELDKYLQN